MNYKNMALVALLLPAFCYSQTKEDRIKELEDRQWEKFLEIEKIGRKITNFYEFTDYVRDNYTKQIHYAVERRERKKKLSSKDSDTNDKQIQKLGQNILDENNIIADHLNQALYGKCTFDYDFVRESFVTELDELNGGDDFDTLKFFFIKSVIGRAFQVRLVTFYQKLLDELCAIGQKLATLKQE